MASTSIMFSAAVLALFATCNGGSSSWSCVYVNGQQKCSSQEDPSGSSAGSYAGTNGEGGVAAAGTGNQDSYKTDYQRIGSGGGYSGADSGAGNGYQSSYGDGAYGGGGAFAASGAGFPNYGFPWPGGWNGDPFRFVNDFFRQPIMPY